MLLVVEGIIHRMVLLNFRVKPDLVAPLLAETLAPGTPATNTESATVPITEPAPRESSRYGEFGSRATKLLGARGERCF
jgi:hypothetical protein